MSAPQPGLVLALNNGGDVQKRSVQTGFKNQLLQPLAWRGKDTVFTPPAVTTNADGWCEVEAPPRGYVVYAGAL